MTLHDFAADIEVNVNSESSLSFSSSVYLNNGGVLSVQRWLASHVSKLNLYYELFSVRPSLDNRDDEGDFVTNRNSTSNSRPQC